MRVCVDSETKLVSITQGEKSRSKQRIKCFHLRLEFYEMDPVMEFYISYLDFNLHSDNSPYPKIMNFSSVLAF